MVVKSSRLAIDRLVILWSVHRFDALEIALDTLAFFNCTYLITWSRLSDHMIASEIFCLRLTEIMRIGLISHTRPVIGWLLVRSKCNFFCNWGLVVIQSSFCRRLYRRRYWVYLWIFWMMRACCQLCNPVTRIYREMHRSWRRQSTFRTNSIR